MLYSMSMSEFYALSVVAEFGFIKGIEEVMFTRERLPRPPSPCLRAITQVGSACRPISGILHLHSSSCDTPTTVNAVKERDGRVWLHKIQKMVQSHINGPDALCAMADEDYMAIEDSSTSKERKMLLLQERNSCLSARRCVEKPNVHRLLELVHTTLPMVGHVS